MILRLQLGAFSFPFQHVADGEVLELAEVIWKRLNGPDVAWTWRFFLGEPFGQIPKVPFEYVSDEPFQHPGRKNFWMHKWLQVSICLSFCLSLCLSI